jgi:hypothetical protein
MGVGIVLYIIIVHWIADFIFQAEEWAINKSKSNSHLFCHVFTYTLMFGLLTGFIFSNPCDYSAFGYCVDLSKLFPFLGITFIAHFITDYITSRIVKRKFENNEYGSPIPNFGAFSIIGFDQVLHYTQLFLTYQFLTN